MGWVLWDWIKFIVRVKATNNVMGQVIYCGVYWEWVEYSVGIKPTNDVIGWDIPNRIYGGG